MAVITIGRVLDATTDSVSTKELNQLVPEEFDHMDLSYTGSNLTSVVYRTGGPAGTIVATLTLAYTGTQLDSVTRT